VACCPTSPPHSPGAWPWATLLVNLTGCLLIGVLVAVLLARFPTHPWLRPFLVTGLRDRYDAGGRPA
jgi:CrcB protein